ncbi:uncharacterized protein LOC123499601 [Portunus trituberculatus]|uniref:uncharacterized protein LOC123499601 n=1 Tax=Portunus trituberculatus TaxID=210409 RepID=UPI001E1CF976|nr:uncharacterized protein LOC123499601 [Portunus trituberculatus]
MHNEELYLLRCGRYMGLTQQSQVTCNIKTDVTTSLYTTSIFAHYRTSESYIGSIPVNSSATAVLKSDLYPPKRLKSRHPVAPQLCVIAVHLRSASSEEDTD